MNRKPWLVETIAAIGALAVFNALLAPGDPGLLLMSPHPLFAVAALIATRYGARAGLASGAACAVCHAGAQLLAAYGGGTGLGLELLRTVSPTSPFLVALTGCLLGEIRERHKQRDLVDRARADRAIAERDALAARLVVAEKARAELEKRVVEPATSMTALYKAAERLDTYDEAALYPAMIQILGEHAEAAECSIYMLEAGKLRLRAWSGGTIPPDERSVEGGLIGTALREKRIVSVRDLLVERDAVKKEGATRLAAPLLSTRGDTLGIIEIRELPFVRINASTQRILNILAQWMGHAIERVRYVRSVEDQRVTDPELGVYRHSFFVPRLEEEFARAMRYEHALSLLIVEVCDWDLVAEASRPNVAKTLAACLRKSLRNVDQVFRYKDPWSFAALLPDTPTAGAAQARTRISEAIEQLALEPYAAPGRLRYTLGSATQEGAGGTAEDLLRAAEKLAAPVPMVPMPIAETDNSQLKLAA